ncbi:DUF4870 domain-containing protein [Oryzihumus sp.]|jgi:uncharacterized Tic20 family protein|uniref:DUF4870 domain-containing protein n=1 Tax=Oryzihumus sp. TaxID=1968903 RepID=UPI002ED98609
MTESPQDVPPQSQGQPPPQGGYPPVPYPGYAVQPPLSPGDARMWALFAHLGGTFLSFLVPLVIYLVYKDRDPFVRRHSSQALNFHITLFIVYLVSIPLMFIIIGFFTFLAAAICAIVFTIMAAIAANAGRDYTYPLAIQFVH